ncbi:MAG: radical SAM protein [Candidatus Acidiferrales bacterium]
MDALRKNALAGTLHVLNGRRDFGYALRQHGCAPLVRSETTTLQINVGKLCNQACHHCHVEAGPKRTEIMPANVAERVLQILDASATVTTVDITGGAPELNPNFRHLVSRSRELSRHVIDRCNLTVLFEPARRISPSSWPGTASRSLPVSLVTPLRMWTCSEGAGCSRRVSGHWNVSMRSATECRIPH